MENDFTDTEATEPIIDGQPEGEVYDEVESAKEYLDLDDYADRYVKVVVDGEELEVPIAEALSGYQRQADYTRKTQQLAEERKSVQFAQAIQQALDNDPKATIELLKNHYGVAPEETSFEDDDDFFVDPTEKQYRSLESRIRAFEEQQAMQELERTIAGLQNKYGEDFDPNEVVSVALAKGTSDLEGVYKQIAFDRLHNRERARDHIKTEKAQQEQKVVQAKRSSGIVAGGSVSNGSAVDSKPVTSLRDAFSAAKQQLGIQ